MRTTHVRQHVRTAQLARINQRLKQLENKTRTIQPLPTSSNKLPVQVSYIIPSTTDANKPLTTRQFQQRINEEKNYIAETYGGDTTIKTVGSYLKDGELIKEPGALIETSMTTQAYNTKRKQLAKHLRNKAKEWKQYQLAIKVEGHSYFIPYDKGMPNDKTASKEILIT